MSSQRTLRSSAAANTVKTSEPTDQDCAAKKKTITHDSLSTTSKKLNRTKRQARDQSDGPRKKARRQTPDSTVENDAIIDRPAEPQRTIAPLITPKGSRHVTYDQESLIKTPKAGLPRPTGTTGNILEQACAHLIKVDSRMQPLIEKHYCRIFCPEGLAEECDPFRSLCSGIMAQQVSGAAASSIKKKFIALFNEPDTEATEDSQPFPTPTQVAACSVPFLRQAGLSERKAEYIKGLAEKFTSGELSATVLMNASDEEVLEKLTAVRGLGKWSVEMFACFGLKRMDILSTGDLGVQRGMAAFLGKDVKKLKAKGGGKWKYLSEQDMLKHSEKFAPYRYVPNPSIDALNPTKAHQKRIHVVHVED
ncbi:3-methyladenine DNA glycosylase [Lecanora helva]